MWISGIVPKTLDPERVEKCRRLGFNGLTVPESLILAQAAETEKHEYTFEHFSRALKGYKEYRFCAGESIRDIFFEYDTILYTNGSQDIITSANPCDNPTPTHRGRPTIITNFVSDLLTFTKPLGEGIVPSTSDACFHAAGLQMPKEKNFSQFCEFASQLLGEFPDPCPPYLYATQLVRRVEALSEQYRYDLMTMFYSTRYPVEMRTEGGISRPRIPVWTGASPLLTTLEEIKANPQYAYVIVRKNNVIDKLRAPETTALQISLINNERAIRGEDSSKASFYCSSNDRGGLPRKSRKQVCDILSLALPILHEKESKDERLYIVPPADHLIPELIEALKDYGHGHDEEGSDFFIVTSDEKIILDYPLYCVPAAKKGHHLLDMKETPIPSFPKGVDIDEAWSRNLNPVISKRLVMKSFVLRRKIPPVLKLDDMRRGAQVVKIRTYKFHSAHAFSFLVSDREKLKRSIGRVEFNEDGDPFVNPEFENLKEMSAADRRLAVFRDSRSRTFALINNDFHCDLGLNLWGIVCNKPTKKDARQLLYDCGEEEAVREEEEAIIQYLAEIGLAGAVEKTPQKIAGPPSAAAPAPPPSPAVPERVEEEVRFDD